MSGLTIFATFKTFFLFKFIITFTWKGSKVTFGRDGISEEFIGTPMIAQISIGLGTISIVGCKKSASSLEFASGNFREFPAGKNFPFPEFFWEISRKIPGNFPALFWSFGWSNLLHYAKFSLFGTLMWIFSNPILGQKIFFP